MVIILILLCFIGYNIYQEEVARDEIKKKLEEIRALEIIELEKLKQFKKKIK